MITYIIFLYLMNNRSARTILQTGRIQERRHARSPERTTGGIMPNHRDLRTFDDV
ncbi:hypothetical protein [Methylobacterium ajmalii]|mgnify:CR=1 FL=1|jgi:hypothetical protein|uniref:hypothetical protein n=1 Tax=Methylobacterium ajmalii TaxID=2738439 RepID=UPI00190A0E63|nr:hypothetical protein [Methylobacterium ajmalii]MBK3400505.1 hypothetical protein [Methylobacterium ajmalii]MBK3410923.1 hypothetical protein [Methylobacterium ajmalii]MBK3421244.1 hypothetical protein [Methylobacterium ajmalii]MBZ6414874.1 hypothetical protein [Methylobacterium sp.]